MARKKCKNRRPVIQDNCITAILVDGGFFRKRLNSVSKDIMPKDAADELEAYCKSHLQSPPNYVINLDTTKRESARFILESFLG